MRKGDIMKYTENFWENTKCVMYGCLFATIPVAIMALIFSSVELVVSCLVLLAVVCVLDTVLANIDPERYGHEF